MKRRIIGLMLTAGMVVALATGAQAQQPQHWTGLYIGANAGYAWGETDITLTPGGRWFTEDVRPFDSHQSRADGFTGGLQFGYNHQIGNVVLGVEVDMNRLDIEGSRSTGLLAPGLIAPYVVSDSFKSHWLATLRPRVGTAVFDQTLLYVTGGLAIGKFDFAQSLGFPTLSIAAGSISGTRVGWTIGGGLERMIAGNWSVKLEYLYVDFGGLGFSSALPPPVAPGYTHQHEAQLSAHIARVGLNYRFH